MSLTVHVKPLDAKDMFYMSESDWNRFGDYLKGIAEIPKAAHDAFVLYAGIAVGGFIAAVTWGAAFSQEQDHDVASVVEGIVFIALTVITAGQAVINWRMDQELRRKVRRDADLLYGDMNRVHPFET